VAAFANDAELRFNLNAVGGMAESQQAVSLLKRAGVVAAWNNWDGLMSFPNFAGASKVLQMPSLNLIADGIGDVGDDIWAAVEFQVVLTTRSAADIVKSVCDNRNFGKEQGGCPCVRSWDPRVVPCIENAVDHRNP
jgi:hypothetical protein